MRRDAIGGSGERAILWLYWLISGYGLRALRSLAALAILGVIVTTALVGWDLAATAPPQHLTGTITSSPGKRTRIDATLNTATPRLPPAGQRWTAQRTRTALQVTLDSIVFRTTSQPLTTAGTWTTIAGRILGPVLLALTLLAVRNHVKRWPHGEPGRFGSVRMTTLVVGNAGRCATLQRLHARPCSPARPWSHKKARICIGPYASYLDLMVCQRT